MQHIWLLALHVRITDQIIETLLMLKRNREPHLTFSAIVELGISFTLRSLSLFVQLSVILILNLQVVYVLVRVGPVLVNLSYILLQGQILAGHFSPAGLCTQRLSVYLSGSRQRRRPGGRPPPWNDGRRVSHTHDAADVEDSSWLITRTTGKNLHVHVPCLAPACISPRWS